MSTRRSTTPVRRRRSIRRGCVTSIFGWILARCRCANTKCSMVQAIDHTLTRKPALSYFHSDTLLGSIRRGCVTSPSRYRVVIIRSHEVRSRELIVALLLPSQQRQRDIFSLQSRESRYDVCVCVCVEDASSTSSTNHPYFRRGDDQ